MPQCGHLYVPGSEHLLQASGVPPRNQAAPCPSTQLLSSPSPKKTLLPETERSSRKGRNKRPRRIIYRVDNHRVCYREQRRQASLLESSGCQNAEKVLPAAHGNDRSTCQTDGSNGPGYGASQWDLSFARSRAGQRQKQILHQFLLQSLSFVPKQQGFHHQVEHMAEASHSPFLRIESQRLRNVLHCCIHIPGVVKRDVPHPIEYLIALQDLEDLGCIISPRMAILQLR
ncbi:hypothetical protein FPOA_27427 [Fusarium poae]|uniref:Uncharacterized protein n=1 Tax=Fusarium poae TaxID=36050 RepID=A0A1B8A7K9_FUSPO|nr:hypothetical protein FPOA_27427 [Fusarium poae]